MWKRRRHNLTVVRDRQPRGMFDNKCRVLCSIPGKELAHNLAQAARLPEMERGYSHQELGHGLEL